MPKPSKATVAATVLAVSVLLNYIHDILARWGLYRGLYRTHPWYVVESIDKCAVVVTCLCGLFVLYRCGLNDAVGELRLNRASWSGILTVVLCTMPMLIGFALARRLDPELSIPAVAFKAFFSPITEEIHARGFTFLQLYRRAKWPFWLAVLPQALLSGFGHIEQGQTIREQIGIFVLIFCGALIFAWTLVEWDSLWVPFALHAGMNLWWELFSVSRNVLGGWFPFSLQQVTMLLVILATYRKHVQRTRMDSTSPSLA